MSPADAARHHLHWETTLDRLELDVLQAERILADPDRRAPEAWQQPAVSGPIPPDLVQRAATIVARPAREQAQLAAPLGTVARHHEFAARVDRATRREGAAVFLDVSA